MFFLCVHIFGDLTSVSVCYDVCVCGGGVARPSTNILFYSYHKDRDEVRDRILMRCVCLFAFVRVCVRVSKYL